MANHEQQRNTVFVERTLAVIKPDAINKAKEIEEEIKNKGFIILQKRRVQLSAEQASEFYADHYNKPFFPNLIAFISGGPIMALVLSRDRAISYWRTMMGPTSTHRARQISSNSFRARYATDDTKNAVHGSDSFSSAEREIRFFFPESIIEPLPVGQTARDYLTVTVNPTLVTGLTEMCKQKPSDPVNWIADWLLEHNPNKGKVKDNKIN